MAWVKSFVLALALIGCGYVMFVFVPYVGLVWIARVALAIIAIACITGAFRFTVFS